MNDSLKVLDVAVGYLVGSYNVREARGKRRYIERIDEGPETPNNHYRAYVTNQDNSRNINDGIWVTFKLEIYGSAGRGEAGSGSLTVQREVDGSVSDEETFRVPEASGEAVADAAEEFLSV